MDKDWATENNTATATNVKGGEEGNHANLNANGTGPFMLGERQPDVKTILVPNPNWWGSMESNVTEAVFTPVGQDATRVAALIAGEIDVVVDIPRNQPVELVVDKTVAAGIQQREADQQQACT